MSTGDRKNLDVALAQPYQPRSVGFFWLGYEFQLDPASTDAVPGPGYRSAGVTLKTYAKCIQSTPDEVYACTEHMLY